MCYSLGTLIIGLKTIRVSGGQAHDSHVSCLITSSGKAVTGSSNKAVTALFKKKTVITLSDILFLPNVPVLTLTDPFF